MTCFGLDHFGLNDFSNFWLWIHSGLPNGCIGLDWIELNWSLYIRHKSKDGLTI